MLRAENSIPGSVRPGHISVAGTPDDLDRFEEYLKTEKGRELLTEIGLSQLVAVDHPVQPGRLWHSDGDKWYPEEPPAASRTVFNQGLDGPAGPLVPRLYRYKPADLDPRSVAQRLAAALTRPEICQELGFQLLTICTDARADHPLADSRTHFWPVGDPHFAPVGDPHFAPVPAAPTRAEGEAAYRNQRACHPLGLDGAAPPRQGEGVTIVILDTSPHSPNGPAGLIDAHDVNYWLDLAEDLPPLEPQAEPRPTQSCALPRLRRVEAPADALDPAALAPYHGPMIAHLCRTIAPKSTIFLVRVLDDQGNGYTSTLIRALLLVMALHHSGHASARGQVVFNLSLGLPRSEPEDVDDYCLLLASDYVCTAGALLVAAAGNASAGHKHRNAEEPGAYGQYGDTIATLMRVMAVAATAELPPQVYRLGPRPAAYAALSGGIESGVYAFFSNEAFMGAYGQDLVLYTGSGGAGGVPDYVIWSGSSFAAPSVAAASALLLAEGIVPDEVKQRLWATATLPTAWNGIRELHIARALAG